MADNNKQDKDNLIDLASQRQRFQNRPAQSGAKKNGTNAPYIGGKKISSSKSQVKTGRRWYHWLQLAGFLGVMWLMMTLCQRGHL